MKGVNDGRGVSVSWEGEKGVRLLGTVGWGGGVWPSVQPQSSRLDKMMANIL
jgi:hypothetical protein